MRVTTMLTVAIFVLIPDLPAFGQTTERDAAIEQALYHVRMTMYPRAPTPACEDEMHTVFGEIGTAHPARARQLADRLHEKPCSWDKYSTVRRGGVAIPTRKLVPGLQPQFEVYRGENPSTSGILLWTVPSMLSPWLELMERDARRAEKNAPPGIVINLCGNPGGELNTTYRMLELFSPYPEARASTVRVSRGRLISRRMKSKGPLSGISTVLAVCEDTASAAELFAGVLKHWFPNKVHLVGSPTYGKGLVQSLYREDRTPDWALTLNLRLVVTSGEFFIGAGTSRKVHGVGLPVDIDMPPHPGVITKAEHDKHVANFGLDVMLALLEREQLRDRGMQLLGRHK